MRCLAGTLGLGYNSTLTVGGISKYNLVIIDWMTGLVKKDLDSQINSCAGALFTFHPVFSTQVKLAYFPAAAR